MYTTTNFKTKKALKDAVASGQTIGIYQPGGMCNPPEAGPTYSGRAYVEGPHYPEPLRWYAAVELKEGVIVKVS